MILHRHRTEGGGARPAHPGKRVLRLRLVLLLIATPLTLVLALALTTTLLPRGFSHAAVSLPVEWVPGDIQNIQDLSGCHARQDATIKTSTPELAGAIRDQQKSLSTPGLKLTSIWKTEVSGSTVSLEIETWYDGECPGPSADARQPPTGADIQPASFHPADMRRAALMKWVKTAFAAVATGVVYATILTVIIGVAASLAASELALDVVAVLAGCVAGAAAGAVGAALFTSNWKDSLMSGIVGCTWGALLGPLVQKGTQLIHEAIAEILGRGSAQWMGRGAAGAALEAGVELQPLSEVVSTTGEAVLRAAQ